MVSFFNEVLKALWVVLCHVGPNCFSVGIFYHWKRTTLESSCLGIFGWSVGPVWLVHVIPHKFQRWKVPTGQQNDPDYNIFMIQGMVAYSIDDIQLCKTLLVEILMVVWISTINIFLVYHKKAPVNDANHILSKTLGDSNELADCICRFAHKARIWVG